MAALLLGALLSAPTASGAASKLVVRIGYVGEPDSLMDKGALDFKKIVEEKSQGRVEVRTFPSSQLGKQSEMIRGVQLGTLEMTIPSTDIGAFEKKFGIFEFPYLFKNRKQVAKLVNGPIGQDLAESVLPKGMRILGFWENGFRQITNNKRPIVKPEDLKGLKIRIPHSPIRAELLKSFGAQPGPLSFGEVFSALQQGVYDGQENPLAQIVTAKFYEVQKYLSMSYHTYTPSYLVISEKFWQGVPKDLQTIMAKAAKDVEGMQYADGEKADKDYLEFMKKHVEVNEVDFKAFQDASRPIYDKFAKEIGEDFVKRALAEVK